MSAVHERLKQIASDGAFGAGRPLRILNASDSGKGEQFQSELAFLQVDLVPDSGKLIKIPVVVKTQIQDENSREGADTATQFFNEVAMYKVVLPKLGAEDLSIAPKMYYGEASSGENHERDLIVLEDLRPQGYKVTPDVWHDFDHVSLTMKKLGQFHGLSYKLKKISSEKLQELANSLRSRKTQPSDGLQEGTIRRAFQQLLDNNPTYSVVSKAYRKISSKTGPELTDSMQKAEEPFAVIAHGDFNKNNVLYSYNESGKVVDMKMFDFAYSMYGEPTMDISFYLYLNTSPELRNQHWNEFLCIYWAGVTSVVEDPGFSFDEFLGNFARKAVQGFIPCSYYLPFLLNPGGLVSQDFANMTSEERVNFFVTVGGDVSTSATTAIVRHLLESGYLEEFLLNFKFDQHPALIQTAE